MAVTPVLGGATFQDLGKRTRVQPRRSKKSVSEKRILAAAQEIGQRIGAFKDKKASEIPLDIICHRSDIDRFVIDEYDGNYPFLDQQVNEDHLIQDGHRAQVIAISRELNMVPFCRFEGDSLRLWVRKKNWRPGRCPVAEGHPGHE